MASYKGPVNRDRQQLAAHVAALLDAAFQPPCPLSAKSCEAVPDVPQQRELPWSATDHFRLRICDADALERACQADQGNAQVKAFLKDLAEQPLERALSHPLSMASLSTLVERFPNFSEVVTYLLRHAALAHLTPNSPMTFHPLVLNGPPGVGKTAFANALAALLGVPILTLQMSHATASFSLGGLDASYSGGGPGLLVRTVALGPSVDPVVLLDELDKAPTENAYDPLGPLFSLWEPLSARGFVDDGLKLPVNCSGVRWICTTNSIKELHPALLSRCHVFSIEMPTHEQSSSIVRQIYHDLLKKHAWGGHFQPELQPPVADLLAGCTPREMTRKLQDALGAAAMEGRDRLLVSDLSVLCTPGRAMGFLP